MAAESVFSGEAFKKIKDGLETYETSLINAPMGEEVELLVRDIKTYQWFKVKAILAAKPEELEGGEPLWVRSKMGRLESQPVGIKVLQREE